MTVEINITMGDICYYNSSEYTMDVFWRLVPQLFQHAY
jgi:hypothetical protein